MKKSKDEDSQVVIPQYTLLNSRAKNAMEFINGCKHWLSIRATIPISTIKSQVMVMK